ncbi:MAG: response regulator [Thermodesulfobacteriota bacterium]|nr:response regulator [Thermodesulfobacteriota bacterium]
MDPRAKFHKKFKEISEERLRKLNDLFLDLEKDTTDQNRLTNIGRELHSLKGEAKMLGFEKTTLLLHKLEDLIGVVKSGALQLKDEASDLAFKGLDSVEELINLTIEGRDNEFDLQGILSLIDSVISGDSSQEKTEKPKPLPDRTQIDEVSPARPHIQVDSIRIDLKKLDRLANMVGQVITNQFSKKNIVKKCQSIQAQQKKITKLWSRLKEDMDENMNSLTEILSEDFMDALGIFHQEIDHHKKECLDLYKAEKADFVNMEMITTMLKGEIMSIRLYPLADMFAMFRRDVRDMARKQKKRVNLKIYGENTEIDRQMIDKLSEIMLHLIRNAIDHGIESEVQRIDAGKSEEGSLKIGAYHKGESVYLEVEDDGMGMQPDELKELAIKNKVITQEEADYLNDKQSIHLIFRSGFSTSTTITDTSGRGMGLHIVKKDIDDLKAEIFIDSEKGKGTRFLLKFPLTLALLKLLLVEMGDGFYGISSQDIEKCVVIRRDEIHIGPEGSTFVYDKRIIPLINLCDLLGVDGEKENQQDVVRVVVVSRQGVFLGLIIDRFVIEQEMVMKNLGEQFGNIKYISGVTTMGGGELVPVLNTSDLFDTFRDRKIRHTPKSRVKKKKEDSPGRILVVEDSLITREMERNILEAAGYSVEVAEDGLKGYSMLEKDVYDLIVTDIEMPRLDGFGLTKKIKEDERLKHLPVIILTTRDNEEDKKMGLHVGADAYFTKGSLEQGNLLDVIQRLI